MLAAEHILIEITLINYSPSFTNITELWNIPSAFYLYPATVPAEGTRNISTAESSGRQFVQKLLLLFKYKLNQRQFYKLE